MTTARADRWSPPKCPRCRWHLQVTARDKSWEARCRNQHCPVGVVPPSVNERLLTWLRERGEVVSTEVAQAFGYSPQNADNHLTALLRLGLVSRRRVDPIKGGKRFAWVASDSGSVGVFNSSGEEG